MDWIVKLLHRALFIVALVFSCAALAQTPAPDPTPGPAPIPTPDPSPSGVQWQIGVGFMSYWGGEDPLINILKLSKAGKDWPVDVFDPGTETFLKLPAGGKAMSVGILRAGAGKNPDFYAGDYIIEWDGDGRLGTGLKGGRGPERREGDNRIRETYDGAHAGSANVQIRAIGKAGVRNIRVYRAEHEAALKAGKIFNPDFVRHIARYDIVRTMDWNAFLRVSRADQIASLDTQYWNGRIVPLEAQLKLAEEAEVSLWLIAPNWLGAPDGLLDRLKAMSKGLKKERVALTAASFDAVDASPEWDKYAARVVAAMEATNYPVDRHFYLELGNETWNWSGPFNSATEWYWALTGALKDKTGNTYPGNPSRGAYGYFSARLAEAFARALDAAGRPDQQWTMVLGAQTGWGQQIIGPLEGVKDYRALTGSSSGASAPFVQPMARFGVATTGYYRGAFGNSSWFKLFGKPMSDKAWRAEWLRRLNQDRDGFAQFLTDAMTADDTSLQNPAFIVVKSLEHQQIAARYGARYIGQYEGSSHDTLDKELAKIPEAVAFYKAWQTGPGHAATIRAHANKMREAFPVGPDGSGVILSNYQHYSLNGVSPKGPWIFNTPWGEETQAEAALNEVVGE